MRLIFLKEQEFKTDEELMDWIYSLGESGSHPSQVFNIAAILNARKVLLEGIQVKEFKMYIVSSNSELFGGDFKEVMEELKNEANRNVYLYKIKYSTNEEESHFVEFYKGKSKK